jgi:hypothetical protein
VETAKLVEVVARLENAWRESQAPEYLAEYDRDSATIITNGRAYFNRPAPSVAVDRETELTQRPELSDVDAAAIHEAQGAALDVRRCRSRNGQEAISRFSSFGAR